jgi:putative effector of murein hydrolase LrgA (UPF0299 family)
MMRCPHCRQPGISPLRKAIMSPGISAVCKTCGKSSGVRYPSWLTAMLPGSVLMIAALLVQSERLEWTLNTAGFLLMIVIPLLFTPLRKQQ